MKYSIPLTQLPWFLFGMSACIFNVASAQQTSSHPNPFLDMSPRQQTAHLANRPVIATSDATGRFSDCRVRDPTRATAASCGLGYVLLELPGSVCANAFRTRQVLIPLYSHEELRRSHRSAFLVGVRARLADWLSIRRTIEILFSNESQRDRILPRLREQKVLDLRGLCLPAPGGQTYRCGPLAMHDATQLLSLSDPALQGIPVLFNGSCTHSSLNP